MMGSGLRIIALLLMSLVVNGITVLAQEETCPEIVQAALDATDEQCRATGRNEACYGNVNLEAKPQPGIDDFTFDAPGDIVAVSAVENLTLSSRVEEAGEWGIALMQLQANLPDSLPGQNVTFLLFGAVEITNHVESIVPEGDINSPEITAPALNPMQAFYFNSGTGDAPCAEAPDSGILVQTPEGVGEIQFTVNDVNITLGSTAYLQAQPGGQMTTSVVEGGATVTAGGASVIVPEGSQVHVPLDAQGRADGTPSQPQPYDGAKMAVLPIKILPRAITIAAPISAIDGIIPAAGMWQATWVPPSISCEIDSESLSGTLTWNMNYYNPFRLPDEEFSPAVLYGAVNNFDMSGKNVNISSPEPNTYVMDYSDTIGDAHFEVRVIDSNHMEGNYELTNANCVFAFSFEMTQVGD